MPTRKELIDQVRADQRARSSRARGDNPKSAIVNIGDRDPKTGLFAVKTGDGVDGLGEKQFNSSLPNGNQVLGVPQSAGGWLLDERDVQQIEPTLKPSTKIAADLLLSRVEGSDRVFYVQRKARLQLVAKIPTQIRSTAPPPDPPIGLPNWPGAYGWKVFYVRHRVGTETYSPGIPQGNGFVNPGFSFQGGVQSNSAFWHELRLYQANLQFQYLNNVSNFTINQPYVSSTLDLNNDTYTAQQFYENTFFIWRFSIRSREESVIINQGDFEVATHFTRFAPPPSTVGGSRFYYADAPLAGDPAHPYDPYFSGYRLTGVPSSQYENINWQLFTYEDINGDGVPDPILPPVPPTVPMVANPFDCYISATKPATSYVLVRDKTSADATEMRNQYFKVDGKVTSLIVPQKKDWRSSRVSLSPTPTADPDFCKNQYRGGSLSFDPIKDCLTVADKKLFTIVDRTGRVLTAIDYGTLSNLRQRVIIESKAIKSTATSCDVPAKPGKKKPYTLPKLKEAGLVVRGIAPIFD